MNQQTKEENDYFLAAFDAIQKRANQNAHDKGFYESKIAEAIDAFNKAYGETGLEPESELDALEDARRIALCHSELSEGLEGLRHGNHPSDHIPLFSAIEEEYADVIIRIMDHCQERGWRLSEAILAKMEFNAGRPHRHGGKKF